MATTRRGLFVGMKDRVAAIHDRMVRPGAVPRSDNDDQALKAAMRDIWRLSRQEKETDPRQQR